MEWEDVEKARTFFRSHGQWVVFVLRFSPFLRTMISLPAGLAHMKHARFLLFTFAGAAVWNTVLIHGGRLLARFSGLQETLGHAILALTAGFIVWYLWRVICWKPKA
jgi:membrane protein DedA with SNARE-associated domain